DRARRSGQLCSRFEIECARSDAEPDAGGTGKNNAAIAGIITGSHGNGRPRFGLAAFWRALQHESQNAARKSCPARPASLASQFFRLPDCFTIAASAEPS